MRIRPKVAAIAMAATLGPSGALLALEFGPDVVDPSNLRRYASHDRQLEEINYHPDVVLIGDSLTENWSATAPGAWEPNWINRGIGGQTSRQVRARFAQDVIALHPRVVHILVGVNDVGKPGAMLPVDETERNIAAMASQAKRAGLSVVLGTVPRVPDWAWKTKAAGGEPAIERLNAWNSGLCYPNECCGCGLLGGCNPAQTVDGIHPTDAGYFLMARVAREALTRS